jgi:integrase
MGCQSESGHMPKLTKSKVDGLASGILWDSELKGFGVRCRGVGKHYVLKLRVGNRQRWITIGRHGSPWTPETARNEAVRLLGVKADKKDPCAEREKDKNAVTVADLSKKFMEEHAAAHLKPGTIAQYQRYVDEFIDPKLGKLRINDVKKADITELQHEMSDHEIQANRCMAILSKMFSLAADDWGLRDDGINPCRGIKRFKENERQRYLSDAEWGRLGRVLDDAKAEEFCPWALTAVALWCLTGCRFDEIRTLRWDYVDYDRNMLRLPDSKTGFRPVFLNAQAIELLKATPRVKGCPFVIVGKTPGQAMSRSALYTRWWKIRARAGLADVHAHDLRHSHAAVGAGANLSLHLIGGLLGHKTAAVTRRYAHLAADPVKAATGLVGDRIAGLLQGPA